MANGTPLPFVKSQWFTDAGAIASGYKLFFYLAGTTTKTLTYSDAAMTSLNANPLVLDSSGRGNVFLPSGVSVKVVMAPPTDTDPPTSPVWTVDGVTSVPGQSLTTDVSGRAGENIAAGEVVYLSDGTAGTTAGRWYLASNANAYKSSRASMIGIAPAAIAIGATGAIRRAGLLDVVGALTAGAIYYVGSTPGTMTSTEPAAGTPRRVVGVADSLVTFVVMGETAKAVLRPRIAVTAGGSNNVGAGETTIYTATIPAGEIATDGMSIHVHVFGATVNNVAAKTIKVKLGSNAVLTFLPTVSEAGRWVIDVRIIRGGAATAQVSATAHCGPAGGPVSKSGTDAAAAVAAAWAAGDTITVTAQGGASDDVAGLAFIVYQFE